MTIIRYLLFYFSGSMVFRLVRNLENGTGVEKGFAGFARTYEISGKYMWANVVMRWAITKVMGEDKYSDVNMRELIKHELGSALGPSSFHSYIIIIRNQLVTISWKRMLY